MDDIARLAKVSKPTVSRVLSGGAAVTPETRERVMAVASAHGYAVNRQARKLRQGRVNAVAVVLDFGSHRGGRIADPFIFELLAGVSEALSLRSQDLLLSPPTLRDAAAHAGIIRARGADGFIFIGQGDRAQVFSELAAAGVPLVVWGAADPAGAYCTVSSDNYLGGTLAAAHFLGRGARRWLFVGDTRHAEIGMRNTGMRAAASANPDISVDQLWVEHMAFADIDAGVRGWLNDHPAPDAVFAFSDTAAMAAAAAFRDRGLQAGRDYALVGYNDIPPAAHFTPPLTTIQQQTQVAGAMLVDKLMAQIEGKVPASATLPTRLVLRDT